MTQLRRVAPAIFLTLAACGRSADRHVDSAAGAAAGPPVARPDSLAALGADSAAPTHGSSPRPDALPVAASPGELAGLRAVLAMPVQGVDPASLRDTYADPRAGHVHEALDIMAPRGTPVLSAADGRLLRLHRSRAGGNMIYAADATDRFILMYAHLDRYAPGLRDGAPLRRGQLLGYVGSTGNASATAPHLHFAIARGHPSVAWWRGTPVNPYPLLAGGGPQALAVAPASPARAPATDSATARASAAAPAPTLAPTPVSAAVARSAVAHVRVGGKRGATVRLLAAATARLALKGKALRARHDTVLARLPATFDAHLGAGEVRVESASGDPIDVSATMSSAPARRLAATGRHVVLRRGGAEIAVAR